MKIYTEEAKARLQTNLATIRKAAGWTAADLGELIGVTKQTISNIENNRMEFWALLEDRIKKSSNNTSIIPVIQNSESCLDSTISTRTYTLPQEEVNVSQHIRTMAVGRHHSAEKAAEAAALGIDLLPNQTLVAPYTKHAA